MKKESLDFEKRHPVLAPQKKDIKIEESLSNQCLRNLELLKKVRPRANILSYYEKILTTDFRTKEIKNLSEQKKKIIGTFCIFVPEELIYACGAIPIRLCAGTYDTISPAEEVLPRDICPLIKSSLGFKILGIPYFELCQLVILPTTCDGKKKLGEILADFLPVWMLEVPQRKDIERTKDLWLGEIKILKKRLEQFSGVKINRERLKQAIKKLHGRQAVFRQLHQLRKHNPALINGRDFLLVAQASFYDDIDRWIEKTEELCGELSNQSAPAKRSGPGKPETPGVSRQVGTYGAGSNQKPRLLLTGAPIIWPNYKILNIIEETEAVIVADELCSGTQSLYDPVEVDEWTEVAMLRAIANRYLLPSTCPCFTESNDRIDRLLNLIEEFKVDGVIYHSLRLCQLYDIESYRVKQVLKDKKIPMLNIHTDYSQEDVEQIKTRVEAFLELLRSGMNS